MSIDAKKGMSKKTTCVIIILAFVIIGAFAVAIVFRPPSTNDLRITHYEREFLSKYDIGGGDYMWTWFVRIKVSNVGSNDVNGAELVIPIELFRLQLNTLC